MQALDFRRILVNSLYSREAILRTYNINARVCLLGVDVDKYRSTGEGREDFVLGVGTIYHGKGVDRAIRAVAEIPAIKRPQLVWVGNGAASTDLTEYRRLAASLGVTLRTMENVTDGEVISLMSRARAMVYPPRLEPFGLAPLEANACETAVAGVAEGGVRESVCEGVNGFLAAEDDPRLLAAALMRILETPEPAELGRRARAHVVEHWSLPHGTRNLIAALSTVARENRDKEHAS
jgi:glycosyltransferase involved in cell wall biosynthesis